MRPNGTAASGSEAQFRQPVCVCLLEFHGFPAWKREGGRGKRERRRVMSTWEKAGTSSGKVWGAAPGMPLCASGGPELTFSKATDHS